MSLQTGEETFGCLLRLCVHCLTNVHMQLFQSTPVEMNFNVFLEHPFQYSYLSITTPALWLGTLNARQKSHMEIISDHVSVEPNYYSHEIDSNWGLIICCLCFQVEVDLGPQYRYHSLFACPILRQQCTDANPPVRLSCGHVISRDALNKLTNGNKYVMTCYGITCYFSFKE